jgi:hypothetical protein
MAQPEPRRAKLGVLGWMVILALVVFLIGAAWFAFYAWNLFPGTDIGTHGTIAMVLGIVISTLVGAGLMGLLFWSSRKGYDR